MGDTRLVAPRLRGYFAFLIVAFCVSCAPQAPIIPQPIEQSDQTAEKRARQQGGPLVKCCRPEKQ